MRLFIFGATGSIGRATLSVAHDIGALVCGLGARRNWQQLLNLCRKTEASVVHLADPEAAEALRREAPHLKVFTEDPREALEASCADVVVNGVSGAAGLSFSLATISAKIPRLALANKESLVMAGELLLQKAKESNTRIIPVDSEHASLFLLLSSLDPAYVEEVFLTASGGPFLRHKSMENITPKQALAHPVWSMGARISVDSATLMNKVFEVVEAHVLFGLPYEKIKVVVHPEGLVHGAIRLRNGTLLLHASAPDMRFAIQQALCYPDVGSQPYGAFDLRGRFSFEEPDVGRFRALEAIEDLKKGAGVAYRVALNAADEVAVEAFLGEKLPFMAIPSVAIDVARRLQEEGADTVEDVVALDRRARQEAHSEVKRWKHCSR